MHHSPDLLAEIKVGFRIDIVSEVEFHPHTVKKGNVCNDLWLLLNTSLIIINEVVSTYKEICFEIYNTVLIKFNYCYNFSPFS